MFTARNRRRITAPHTRTFSHGEALAFPSYNRSVSYPSASHSRRRFDRLPPALLDVRVAVRARERGAGQHDDPRRALPQPADGGRPAPSPCRNGASSGSPWWIGQAAAPQTAPAHPAAAESCRIRAGRSFHRRLLGGDAAGRLDSERAERRLEATTRGRRQMATIVPGDPAVQCAATRPYARLPSGVASWATASAPTATSW